MERQSDVIYAHDDVVSDLAYSKNGDQLYSCSHDGTVKIWDLRRLMPVRSLSEHKNGVRALAIHPQGECLAALGRGYDLVVWDANYKKMGTSMTQSDANLAFTPDGRHLVCVQTLNRVTLYNWRTMETLNYQRHSDRIFSLAVSPDGRYLASGGYDGTVHVWNLKDNVLTVVLSAKATVIAVTFSHDGSLLLASDQQVAIRAWTVGAWDCEPKVLSNHGGSEQSSLACHPDGSILVAGSSDGRVYVWDMAKIRCCEVLSQHGRGVCSVAISPNGKQIASGGGEGQIKLWNVKKPHQVA